MLKTRDSENVDLYLPDEFYSGNAVQHSWCGKAAAAAKRQCHLFTESDRMMLATLITNCHLESVNRELIPWNSETKLIAATDAQITLIMHVVSQLESVCMQTGTSWTHALMTEQGEHFRALHNQLEDLQRTARELTEANSNSLQSAQIIARISEGVDEMRQSVLMHSTNISNTYELLQQHVARIYSARDDIFQVQEESIKSIRDLTDKLTAAISSMPKQRNGTQALLSELRELLQERLVDNQVLSNRSGISLLAALILAISLTFWARPLTALIFSMGLGACKFAVEFAHARLSNSTISSVGFSKFLMLTIFRSCSVKIQYSYIALLIAIIVLRAVFSLTTSRIIGANAALQYSTLAQNRLRHDFGHSEKVDSESVVTSTLFPASAPLEELSQNQKALQNMYLELIAQFRQEKNELLARTQKEHERISSLYSAMLDINHTITDLASLVKSNSSASVNCDNCQTKLLDSGTSEHCNRTDSKPSSARLRPPARKQLVLKNIRSKTSPRGKETESFKERAKVCPRRSLTTRSMKDKADTTETTTRNQQYSLRYEQRSTKQKLGKLGVNPEPQ